MRNNLRDDVTLVTPPFRKLLVLASVETVPGSARAKFEVHIFRHFEAIST